MSNITSPFATTRPFPSKKFDEEEYIHYQEVERISSDYDPKNPSEFLIEKTSEEYERIPIREYINSFASKVGLKNELKGIISKQQMDEFISTHKASPGFVDLTELPDTALEMKKYSELVEKVWSEIPSELKGSLTKEEFIKTITAEKLKTYVTSQIPKSEEKKEGE